MLHQAPPPQERADRERRAGRLRPPAELLGGEAAGVFPGAGGAGGELLRPELYTDEELRGVGLTEE